jgi:hypothetical protein
MDFRLPPQFLDYIYHPIEHILDSADGTSLGFTLQGVLVYFLNWVDIDNPTLAWALVFFIVSALKFVLKYLKEKAHDHLVLKQEQRNNKNKKNNKEETTTTEAEMTPMLSSSTSTSSSFKGLDG